MAPTRPGAASLALRNGVSASSFPVSRKLVAAASAVRIPNVSFWSCTRKAADRAATAAVCRSLSRITLPDSTQTIQKAPNWIPRATSAVKTIPRLPGSREEERVFTSLHRQLQRKTLETALALWGDPPGSRPTPSSALLVVETDDPYFAFSSASTA